MRNKIIIITLFITFISVNFAASNILSNSITTIKPPTIIANILNSGKNTQIKQSIGRSITSNTPKVILSKNQNYLLGLWQRLEIYFNNR